MKIAALIRAMSAAGASAEAIALAVEAIEAQQEADLDRRAKQAARTAKCRARKRDGDVTVTRPSRDPSPPPALPPEPPNPPTPTPVVNPRLPAEAAPKGASHRGSALPEDWQPKARHFAVAARLGLPDRWVHDRAAAMREWAGANRNRSVARKADWDLNFDGWLRRDVPAAKAGRSPPLLLPITGGAVADEPRIDFGNGQLVSEKLVLDVLRRRDWIDTWGPRPGHPACRLPDHIAQVAFEAVA